MILSQTLDRAMDIINFLSFFFKSINSAVSLVELKTGRCSGLNTTLQKAITML